MIPRLVLIVLAFSTIACYTSSALVEQQPTEQPTQPAVLPTDQALAVVAAAEALNVRTGPAVSYPPTSYLAAGSAVEIVSDCVNGWVKIEYQDRRGWVNADYLSGSICE